MRKLIKETELSLMEQIREFIPERNTMNVLTVGKPFSGRHSLLSIREFTLGRNPLNAIPMNVMNVGEPFERKPTCMIIREFILEKNPILVRNVGKTSAEVQLLLNTREFILEINSRNCEIKEFAECFS
ncbi:hypothetical protein EGM_11880 [Macaca fascicularis]|uniref:Uncharacterized protein n=1 Tax=Macaca fascicularis TaxID=9541 RepID=G7Q1H0_MACFA|nr:hypothetical protein EGM_11880 [Macaca fascicularis]